MKRILITVLSAIILLTSACSSTAVQGTSNSESTKVEEINRDNIESEGETNESEGTQVITYFTLSLKIPENWKYIKNDDDSILIYRSNDSNFYCGLDGYNISENVDENTTEDDVYALCVQLLQNEDGSVDADYDTGHFADCPAVFFTRKATESDGSLWNYSGVVFAADVNMYIFFYSYPDNEDHENEKVIGEKIKNSITISPEVNTGVYNSSLNNENDESTNNEEQENSGWVEKENYKIRIKEFRAVNNLDTDTFYSYIIEVENTCNSNLALEKCPCDIEDSEGSLAGFGDGDSVAAPPIIRPGEKGYFYGIGQVADADASKEYVLVPKEKLSVTDTNPIECEVSDTSLRDYYGIPMVIGRVTNNSGIDLSYILIHIVFYNADGEVIGISMASVGELQDGATESFEGGNMYINTAEVADYKVIASRG